MANLVFDVCFANRVTLVSGEEVVLSVRFFPDFACIILKSVNICIVTPLTVLKSHVGDDGAAG